MASALAVAAAIGVVRRADAQTAEPPPDAPVSFGAGGQFVLSVDRLAGFDVSIVRSDSQANGAPISGGCSGTSVTASFFGSTSWMPSACSAPGLGGVRWGADVFVARGFSVGGALAFTSQSDDSNANLNPVGAGTDQNAVTGRSFTFSPRIGYAHAIDSNWTVWPRVGIDWTDARYEFEHHFQGPDGTATADRSNSAWHLIDATVDVKFVYQPVPHVAVFGGPFATLPVWMHSDQDTNGASVEYRTKSYQVGAQAGILLYF